MLLGSLESQHLMVFSVNCVLINMQQTVQSLKLKIKKGIHHCPIHSEQW